MITRYGIITDIYADGNSGGNGRVLFGNLNKKSVAIKVLYQKDENKRTRFKEEFINVLMNLQKVPGVVEQYLYDEVNVEGSTISYIIMKQYNSQLKNKAGYIANALKLKLLDLYNPYEERYGMFLINFLNARFDEWFHAYKDFFCFYSMELLDKSSRRLKI